MRGLESPHDDAAGPLLASPPTQRPRRLSPRTIAILILAGFLTLCLFLPSGERMHAFTDQLTTSVGASLGSISGYVGWRTDPANAQVYATSADENATFVPAMHFDSTLPACTRTFVFSFAMQTGFNGQMGLLVRAAVLAEAMGYHILLDDDDWIYGRWTDYFASYVPPCLPAEDWRDRTKRVGVSHRNEQEWRQADHVWGPIGAGYLDDLTLALHSNRTFLDAQHRRDIESYPPSRPLASHHTVPTFFVEAFKAQTKWMAKFWQLSPELLQMVEAERDLLGWDLPGWDDRPRRSPSNIVIGAHVRMGDKCYETTALKAGPLRFAKQLYGEETDKSMDGEKCDPDGKLELDDRHAQAYFDAAAAEVNAILAEHAGEGIPEEPSFETTKWKGEKPTLIIMSDEDAVLDALRAHEGSRPFRLLHTANAKVEALEHGFIGGDFLNVALADRIRSTRPMVRDMELLSRHAGGLVMMAISNVGRALALLPGFTEVQEGRLMSVDLTVVCSLFLLSLTKLTASTDRWFPTAYYN